MRHNKCFNWLWGFVQAAAMLLLYLSHYSSTSFTKFNCPIFFFGSNLANANELLSTSHAQEVLTPKQITSLPISAPATSDTYATLTSVVTDNYDKQELNIIFDSLLQKWPETGSFSDPSAEVRLDSQPVFCFSHYYNTFMTNFIRVDISLFPTAIPFPVTTPAPSTRTLTPAPRQKDSGMSFSLRSDLLQLLFTRPGSFRWCTWTKASSTPSLCREWTTTPASQPPKSRWVLKASFWSVCDVKPSQGFKKKKKKTVPPLEPGPWVTNSLLTPSTLGLSQRQCPPLNKLFLRQVEVRARLS